MAVGFREGGVGGERGTTVRLGQTLRAVSQKYRRATIPGRGGRSVFLNMREMMRTREVGQDHSFWP